MLIESKRPFVYISFFLILTLAGIVIYQEYQKNNEKNKITIITGAGPVTVYVEYVSTPEEREKGLMSRTSLGQNSGMLFTFSDEQVRHFWMKNTLIPLDIIFISATGRVNEIITAQPCLPESGNPCPDYPSKDPAKYVLEVNAGFTAANRIIEGDILELSGF